MWATLGTFSVTLGSLAGAVTVLDWMLLKSQKDWIRGQASSVWIWLSYQRSLPMLAYLRHTYASFIIAFLGLTLPVAANLYLEDNQELLTFVLSPSFLLFVVVADLVTVTILRDFIGGIWSYLVLDLSIGKCALKAVGLLIPALVGGTMSVFLLNPSYGLLFVVIIATPWERLLSHCEHDDHCPFVRRDYHPDNCRSPNVPVFYPEGG